MSPRIRTTHEGKLSPEEAADDVQFCVGTAEFQRHDRELRLALTSRLYDHIGHWLERLGQEALIVGSLRGRDSRTCFAAAMSFSEREDGGRTMVFVEMDPMTQLRRRAPLLVEVEQAGPVSEHTLPFALLLEAVAISDPACPGTRQIGLHQFGEIANSAEAPD